MLEEQLKTNTAAIAALTLAVSQLAAAMSTNPQARETPTTETPVNVPEVEVPASIAPITPVEPVKFQEKPETMDDLVPRFKALMTKDLSGARALVQSFGLDKLTNAKPEQIPALSEAITLALAEVSNG